MLNNLKPNEGSRVKSFKKCRGVGSGLGKNGGTGHKGQNSRSGGGVRLGFEGGQNPLYRRLPKRGFKNFGKTTYAVINLTELNVFEEGSVIDMTLLIDKNLIKKEYAGLKVLGDGELTKKITVKAHKFSKTAIAKIEQLGGKAEIIE